MFCTFKLSFVVDIYHFLAWGLFGLPFEKLGKFFKASVTLSLAKELSMKLIRETLLEGKAHYR